MSEKVFLHVGCGPATKATIEKYVQGLSEYREVRMDIDDQYAPDIVGDLSLSWRTWKPTALVGVGFTWTFDLIYSSHVLEHLHPYDVRDALVNFRELLKPDGRVFIIVPDFAHACRQLASEAGMLDLYDSPAGSIGPHEVVFGKEDWTADNPHMIHRTGFTPDLLRGYLLGAGFAPTSIRSDSLNLIAQAKVLP